MEQQIKNLEIRCPKLGHQINFSYCEHENNGLPCSKSLDCWYNYFPVEKFLRNKLSPEEWSKVFENSSKSKMNSLIELIKSTKEKIGK